MIVICSDISNADICGDLLWIYHICHGESNKAPSDLIVVLVQGGWWCYVSVDP
jgi:hypothetical protein